MGRLLRAAPTMLRVGFASAVAYRSEMLVWILTTNMPLVMLVLFRNVAQDAPIGRFSQNGISTYFLVTLVVRLLTSAWVVWELVFEVKTGTLASRLLRPVHPLLSYALDNLAALPLRLLVVVPISIGTVLWLGTGELARDPVLWACVVPATVGAWAITFCVMAMIGTLSLWWDSSLSLYDLWIGLYFVLSGYLVPLDLLPPAMLAVVKHLPFRYVLGYPVELVMGLTTRGHALRDLGLQWVWVAACVFAMLALFQRGLRRFAAFGG